MTIGMWFQDDLANLLASVAQTQMSIMGHLPKTPETRAYQSGCVDTLAALSIALGFSPKQMLASQAELNASEE